MDNFDWKYYIENNQDLIENNITTKEKAIKHWNIYGKSENRKHKFINNFSDSKNLLNEILKQIDTNNILITYNILTKEDSWDSLNNLLINKNESINKNMDYFDCEYYSKNNIDLKNENIIKDLDLKNHWLKYGQYENRKYKFFENFYLKKIPFKYFDWKYYIKNNIDLIDYDIITPEQVWNHWCNYGKYEDRKYKWIKHAMT